MSDFDENAVIVPAELLDPDAVLNGTFTPIRPSDPEFRADVVSGLSCAARNGTAITPETRQQMNNDRKKAEQKDGHGSN